MVANSRSQDLVLDAWNMEIVGHSDLGGYGNAMHVNLQGDHAFVGHMDGRGTSIVDVSDPSAPRLAGNIPAPANTRSHKVQIVGDTLLVNREELSAKYGGRRDLPWARGLDVYDVADPTDPQHLAFWACEERGLHRMAYWEEPYAYVTAGRTGYDGQFLVILDLSDRTAPVEVASWWMPGQKASEPRRWEPGRNVNLHHALPRGDRLYCGWWDAGLVILDIADKSDPRLVSHLEFGPDSRHTHTACPVPGRDLLIVTEECVDEDPPDHALSVYLVDISDDTSPSVVSTFPVPEGDFRTRGLRFGPHNVHEPRPGSLQDPNTVYLTYFNAGLRVLDISDTTTPTEIAWCVPKAAPGEPTVQMNDVLVAEDGLVFTTDRVGGGLYIMRMDEAAARG